MKSIEIQGLVQGSDDWRRWRQGGIGGSDAPIVGLPPGENLYGKDATSLWREKVGISEAQFNATAQAHTKRGHDLEPQAREEFIRRTGIWVEPVCMQSTTHPFMLASLDGMNAARNVGCEIKAPAEKMFRQMLLEGTPSYYIDQLQHQLYVTQADEFYFWAFNPDIEPYVFVERHVPDYGRIQEIIRKVSLFWRHVENNIPPSQSLGVSRANVGILGLTEFGGYARQGKDTVGMIHQDLFATIRYAFADPLKQMYSKLNHISMLKMESEKEKHRPGLIDMGHGMRGVDPDIWVNGVFNGRSGIYESMTTTGAIITDTRYLNEASAGRRHAARLGVPFRLIWVERPDTPTVIQSEIECTSLLRAVSDIIFVNDMDIKSEVGKRATEMAIVYCMSIVPEGKQQIISASNFRSMAEKDTNNEPKRSKVRRTVSKKRKS